MGQGMVRIDRGDGRLLQFQPKDADEFIKATPGAKRVAAPSGVQNPTAAENAATAAQGAKDGDVDSMTVAQLKEHAEANDIDLDGATVKADIIAAIKNAEAANSND